MFCYELCSKRPPSICSAYAPIVIKSKNPEFFQDVLKKSHDYNKDQDQIPLTDVVLKAGEDGISRRCHRIVLSLCSPYFKAMFSTPMLESSQTEITLHDVHSEQLGPLISFCYSGQLKLAPNADVRNLLATAAYLLIDEAREACEEYLKAQILPSNCISTWAVAENHFTMSLLEHVTKYINHHFKQIIQHSEFTKLGYQHLLRLIRKDELAVSSEEVIFHGIMTWVNHDRQHRSHHAPALMKRVRVWFVPMKVLLDEVNPAFQEFNCVELLGDVLYWQHSPLPPSKLSLQQTCRRKPESADMLAVYWMDDHYLIDRYCTIVDKWRTFDRIDRERTNTGRYWYASAFYNKCLIIVAGDENTTMRCQHNTIECYNVDSKSCRMLAPMPTARVDAGVVVLGGHLYIVGGANSYCILNIVERYDLNDESKGWEEVASMKITRKCHAVAVLDGLLYAVGGKGTNNTVHKTTECYDPVKNQWQMRSSMNQAKSLHGIVAGRGCLYVVGGYDGTLYLSSVECYNPSCDHWLQIGSLNQVISCVNCAILGERLLAVGGCDRFEHPVKSVDEYDFSQSTWSRTTPLLQTDFISVSVVSMPMLDYTN